MTERTLSIIKPDATRAEPDRQINAVFEDSGLRDRGAEADAAVASAGGGVLRVHRERGFFRDLVTFMTSGPVVVQVLEGADAVAQNRKLMGATNPANAEDGTIRKMFAESIEANSVHGSDSPENAASGDRLLLLRGLEIVG